MIQTIGTIIIIAYSIAGAIHVVYTVCLVNHVKHNVAFVLLTAPWLGSINIVVWFKFSFFAALALYLVSLFYARKVKSEKVVEKSKKFFEKFKHKK